MGKLLTTSSQLMCPHGGTVTAITSNARTKAAGAFLLRSSDTFTVAGCPLVVGTVAHPCVQVRWVQPNLRSTAGGDATVSDASTGLCVAADQAVQGTVQVMFAQARVSGS